MGDTAFDDTDWGLSAGLHWSPAEQWSVGGFYRQGPDFDLTFELRAGPAAAEIDPSFAPGEVAVAVAAPMSFPDVYGLGVAFRSRNGKLAVGLEWDRVEYSTIFDSFDPTLQVGDPDEVDLEVQLTAADDADELHLGVEHAFLDADPVIAIRLGAWLDPDHRFRSITDDPEHRALLPPGDDEAHLAVGFGLAFESFQVDLGLDFSDSVDTASLSVIYSF